MIATLKSVRSVGMPSALTQSCSKALSIMNRSLSWMATPEPFKPSVQDFSHGAGHTRPVISGSGFVFAKRSKALLKSPR